MDKKTKAKLKEHAGRTGDPVRKDLYRLVMLGDKVLGEIDGIPFLQGAPLNIEQTKEAIRDMIFEASVIICTEPVLKPAVECDLNNEDIKGLL